MIGEGTGGVTEGLKRRVVLPLAGTLAETDHVLGHELVHAFQYDISAQRAPGGGVGGGIEALPLWFVEGLAEYLSIGPVDPHTAMWLRDATRKEKLPQIKDLDSGEFFPYRWGQAVWAYIGGKYGDDLIGQIFRDCGPLRRSDRWRSKHGHAHRRQGTVGKLARRHPRAVRAGDARHRARAHVRALAHRRTIKRRWRPTCRRRSAPTAATSSFSRRAICSRSICILRKRRPDASCASSSTRR